ncbi:hypothetical protein ACI2K4_30090 [Micromonospora sp. NPDC050397]|uniref:hypothetical protein n=1 Tax=Micromonospora sp. NPDC050397 TaxID=3364279 RepID=UPI00384B6F9E
MRRILDTGTRRFGFAFARPFRLPLAVVGVRPDTAWVDIRPDGLTVRYGPWRLHSPLENVTGAERAGPYKWWRVLGPHLSMVDRGVSFGTTAAAGVCIRFRDPVPGLVPGGRLRHPAVTVTVDDPDGLVQALLRTAG